MRGLARVLILLAPLALGYMVWPVYAALEIRQAFIAGDTATLNRKVDWPALRASIKSSITPQTIARLMQDPQAPKPTLWQRIKAAVAPSMTDTIIDRYVTPENLPVLLGYRRIYRGTAQPALDLAEPRTVLAGTWLAGTRIDQFASFWVRLRRAVFYSPTRFEIEAEDQHHPGRRYIGTLEREGFEWKLTGLSVAGGDF
ncbi:MAG TPA: DUF2939 domain-containing protein [Hyphomicrobiaceae bacterium]|nr:DUF2939 domain-containing protein [Hyphomicrobiaceae bacterium]